MKRLLALFAFPLALAAPAAEDARQLVAMPAPAQAAMREEMLDFMGALNEIIARLGEGRPAEAAAVADAKLGFPAMGRHRGSPPEAMPGRYMPATMHEMGRTLHRLADEFARTARKGDLAAAVAALQPVTANCVACHLSYRIR